MPITRRSALAFLGSGALAAATLADGARPVISYQLYSSRKFGPLPDTLAMLAGVGYRAVEGGEPQFSDAATLRATRGLLSANGLAMPSAHIGLETLEKDPAWAIEVARTLGVRTMYCAWLPPRDRPATAPGFAAFGRRLSAAGRPLRDVGIAFGWHNHDFEVTHLPDGALPLGAILDGGPDVEWQADIGWIVRSGADPSALIARFGSRITSVHVKDVAPPGRNAGEGGWADVGTGIVPWPVLIPALRRTPARTFVVEHDDPSDDERFARIALANLRSF